MKAREVIGARDTELLRGRGRVTSWGSLWEPGRGPSPLLRLCSRNRMVVSVRENEGLGQYGGAGETLCEDVHLRVWSCPGGQEMTLLTRDCLAPRSAATASGPRGDVEGLAGSPPSVSLWRRRWCQCKTPTGFRRPPFSRKHPVTHHSSQPGCLGRPRGREPRPGSPCVL